MYCGHCTVVDVHVLWSLYSGGRTCTVVTVQWWTYMYCGHCTVVDVHVLWSMYSGGCTCTVVNVQWWTYMCCGPCTVVTRICCGPTPHTINNQHTTSEGNIS